MCLQDDRTAGGVLELRCYVTAPKSMTEVGALRPNSGSLGKSPGPWSPLRVRDGGP